MSEKNFNEREEGPPLRFELTQADDYSKYLLHSKKEILFILRAMRDKGDLITVYFNQGNDFLLTTLLAVTADGDALLLDPGSNAEMNRRALASDKLICTASHDKVKIQFILRRLTKTEYEGREAFRAAVPEELLRLQRREFYRLTTPIAHPLRCLIPVRLADGSQSTVETTVIDISGGGLAVMAPPEGIEFETDHLFENCRIELPDVGTVLATLRVRNVFEFTLRNGARTRRAGCQFLDLSGQMLTLIQRYIIRVERERKARETGMM
jgi:c-di-GMP-binding flagellar brake protein YcgR